MSFADYYGRLYGYPACCIASFPFAGARDDNPFMGSGFIPCKPCAEAARADPMKWIAENVTPRRRFAHPFPHDDMGMPGWTPPVAASAP